jgi:hypothetical protein
MFLHENIKKVEHATGRDATAGMKKGLSIVLIQNAARLN